MSSEAFWNRWWTLLRHQRALWLLALVRQVPGLLLALLFVPFAFAAPALEVLNSPEAFEAWVEQNLDTLLGASVAVACLGFVVGLAAFVLASWSRAGMFALVRRVWGEETRPVPWRAAIQGLLGPTLRLLGLKLVGLVLLVGVPLALLFGSLSLTIDNEDPGPFLAVFLGGLCLYGLAALALWPWWQGLRVALVVEHPAPLGETLRAYWNTMRRGWLGMYAMVLVHLGVALALGLMVQIVAAPLNFLSMAIPEESGAFWALSILIGLVLVALQSGVRFLQELVMDTGWAALYTHYRFGEPASAVATVWTPATAPGPEVGSPGPGMDHEATDPGDAPTVFPPSPPPPPPSPPGPAA